MLSQRLLSASRIRREFEQAQSALAHQEQVLKEAASILGVTVGELQSTAEKAAKPDSETSSTPSQPASIAPKKFGQKYSIPVVDGMAMAMVEKGKELPVGEIGEYLANLGITPSRSSLRSMLVQYDKRFKRISPGVYDLVDRDAEEARIRAQGRKTEEELSAQQVRLKTETQSNGAPGL